MPLLIFDCDGVLVDSEMLHSEIECEVAKEVLGIESDIESHHRRFTGGGMTPIYNAWEQEWGKKLPVNITDIIAHKKNEAFALRLEIIPYIKEALEQLADVTSCVASGTPLKTLTTILNATHLLKYFAPNLFTAEMVERGKPAPDIFLYAAAKMGIAPEDCLVIEDSVHGVNAALAANMKVLGFAGGSHCEPDHQQKLRGAMHVIDDMRELPFLVRSIFTS